MYFEVSEGIDFVDNESRGVIVVGVPYAPTTNPRIELKKQFLAKQRAGACKEELKKVSAEIEIPCLLFGLLPLLFFFYA